MSRDLRPPNDFKTAKCASFVACARQFLTTMSADVIKAVKLAALEGGMNAWEIMEEAAEQWLARRKKSKRKA